MADEVVFPTVDTSTLEPGLAPPSGRSPRLGVALCIVWAADEAREGQVLRFPTDEPASGWLFGRDDGASANRNRLYPLRQRPTSCDRGEPLKSRYISRDQLRLVVETNGVRVENIGRCPLRGADGRPTQATLVRPGDLLELEGQLLLLCVARPFDLPPLREKAAFRFGFGEADAHGIVGESPQAWSLRDSIAFMAASREHVLLLGESGTGKELVARAIHATSARGPKALVARNAATFPPGLIDAELFGNIANYPNAGSPERPGLIGQAHGSTLLLDEIGDLSPDLTTHLLRVLDEGGEYQRLGESKQRRADVRLIGATNRPLDQLRPDFAARFKLRLRVPGLNERREDIPLLARHLLGRMTASEGHRERFLDHEGGQLPCSLPLMRALVTHDYRTHVRELESLLWRSTATSKAGQLELTPELRDDLRANTAAPASAPPASLTPERIKESLERNGGVKEKAWRELGLSSRYALKRLLKKYGIADRDDESNSPR